MLGLVRHRAGGHAGVAARVRQGDSGDVEHGAIRGDGEGVLARQRVAVLQPGDLRLGVACAGGEKVLVFMQSFSTCARSLTGVTVLELFWEAGTSAQIKNYHDLDQIFRDCWTSQQEERKLS